MTAQLFPVGTCPLGRRHAYDRTARFVRRCSLQAGHTGPCRAEWIEVPR